MLNRVKQSKAEKCFDFGFWGILTLAVVRSVLPENNSIGVKQLFTSRSQFLPWGFSKFVFVLLLLQFEVGQKWKSHKNANFYDFHEF